MQNQHCDEWDETVSIFLIIVFLLNKLKSFLSFCWLFTWRLTITWFIELIYFLIKIFAFPIQTNDGGVVATMILIRKENNWKTFLIAISLENENDEGIPWINAIRRILFLRLPQIKSFVKLFPIFLHSFIFFRLEGKLLFHQQMAGNK